MFKIVHSSGQVVDATEAEYRRWLQTNRLPGDRPPAASISQIAVQRRK